MKLFLSAFLFTLNASASTLIVSDIDDTLKQSFILSRWGALENAQRIHNDFFGMSELYKHLTAEFRNPEFVYLSSAPTLIMQKAHARFLEKNEFPKGRLITRRKYSEEIHKIQNLRLLLAEKFYDQVILIGDNGQRDTTIYKLIAQEFPQTEFHSFIRIAYSVSHPKYVGAPLEAHQVGFVTPVDILSDLAHKNKIDFSKALEFASDLIPLLMMKPLDEDEKSVTFPVWQDCRDYQNLVLNFSAAKISEFNEFIATRCL